MLSTRYKRISGGGNTALGGEVMIARSSIYTFTPDGRFRIEGSVGASNSGEQTGVSTTLQSESAMAGRYALDDHTLVLTYSDGRRSGTSSPRPRQPPELDPG
jgi:hypothetical protein